ncbi:LLM class flavin-dependent oxidoreductase [Streptomyces sp. NPDC021225]|uniref:LLM class flavin-dependent oxidoreductase n=1 Tax=Streptomyces sp. NPDC021225 TaxID=3365121 RepID=UPI00379A7D9F
MPSPQPGLSQHHGIALRTSPLQTGDTGGRARRLGPFLCPRRGLPAESPGADIHELARLAREAEDLGYDGVWLPDHLLPSGPVRGGAPGRPARCG